MSSSTEFPAGYHALSLSWLEVPSQAYRTLSSYIVEKRPLFARSISVMTREVGVRH